MDKDFSRGIYDPRFQTEWDRLKDSSPTPKRPNKKPRIKSTPDGKPITKRLSGRPRRNQVIRIASRDGWECFWCGVTLSLSVVDPKFDTEDLRHPTIDHLMTKAQGGSNNDDNCVISCQSCNGARVYRQIGGGEI